MRRRRSRSLGRTQRQRQALRRSRRRPDAGRRHALWRLRDRHPFGRRARRHDEGGAQADTFHYHAHTAAFNQSALGDRDTILDFSGRQGDRFDLREIKANTASAGDQAFSLVARPSVSAGRMWIECSGQNRTVFLTVNGGGADLAIDVQLASGTTGLICFNFLL